MTADTGKPREPSILGTDELAQFRGCEPSNDCYFDCCEAARSDIAEQHGLYPGELDQAEAWAAAQTWT